MSYSKVTDTPAWYGQATVLGAGDVDQVGVEGDRSHTMRRTGVEDIFGPVNSSTPLKREGFKYGYKTSFGAGSLRSYLNKPLPAIPGRGSAHWRQASAAVGAVGQTIYPASDVALTQNVSDEDISPTLVDMSTAAEFAFAMAGVELTSKDIIENHLAALGTGLEGHLQLDEADEVEKQKATEDFYVAIKSEEAPGDFHAPLIDETSGYGDFRQGMEEHPEMWQSSTATTALNEGVKRKESKREVFKKTPGFFKTILKPKSRKALLPKQQDVVMVEAPLRDNLPPAMIQPALPDSMPQAMVGPVTPAVRRSTRFTKPKRFNKRSAPQSFSATSTCYAVEDDDGIINVLPTKKLRITEHEAEPEIQDAQSLRAVSVHSDDSDYSMEESTSEVLYPGIPNPKRTTPTLQGYPGQFPSLEATYLARKKSRRSPVTFSFGNPLHPNHVYTHQNFIPDPDSHTTDYTRRMLDRLPMRNTAWEHASTMAVRSAKVLIRSASEEDLRREGQLECAGARLEGVGVGQYRYFQGHMSVEEYRDANMCVCWGECYCSKLCTRFGDVLCPCSKDIKLPEN